MRFIDKSSYMCVPEYFGQNLDMNHIYAKCKCDHVVVSYQNYCSECGVELDWKTVREELHKKGLDV